MSPTDPRPDVASSLRRIAAEAFHRLGRDDCDLRAVVLKLAGAAGEAAFDLGLDGDDIARAWRDARNRNRLLKTDHANSRSNSQH
jgi:hypothetical protein